MLLQSISVNSRFGVGTSLYNIGGAGGSIAALVFGVLFNIRFSRQSLSAFDLIVILILTVGGLGLFLRSLRSF